MSLINVTLLCFTLQKNVLYRKFKFFILNAEKISKTSLMYDVHSLNMEFTAEIRI